MEKNVNDCLRCPTVGSDHLILLEGYLNWCLLASSFFSSFDNFSRFSQSFSSLTAQPSAPPTTYIRLTKMFSFRSIFAAAVALATFTSAVPLGSEVPGTAVGDLLKRGGDAYKTPGDISNECGGKIAPIVDQISQYFILFCVLMRLKNITAAIVAVEGFDHADVTDCFNQISVLLTAAIGDIQVLIAAKVDADVLLTVNGVVCTVADVAAAVFALLKVRIGPNFYHYNLSSLAFSLSLTSLRSSSIL